MPEDVNADVVIVGSGIAGGHAAYRLAQHGIDVLVLEAGPRLSRLDAMANFIRSPYKGPNSPYPPQAYAPYPTDQDPDAFYVQAGPDRTGFSGPMRASSAEPPGTGPASATV